jgi:hypothetical protein
MFDAFRFRGLAPKRRAAAVAALSETTQALDHFDLKIGAGAALSPLTEKSHKFLHRTRGAPKLGKGFSLASRMVRQASTIAMIETMLHYANEHACLRSGHKRLRMITFCPDVGLVDIAGSDFPMRRTKDTIRRAMQSKRLQGFGMLDLAPFSPIRGHAEDRIHIHSHQAVSYDDGTDTKNKSWVDVLAPASGNVNAMDGPVVYISRQDPELSAERVAGLAWYVTKESCGANTIYEAEEGQKSECSFTDWTFPGALRQLEFWSYVDARDACWSTGDLGGKMRLHWRKRLLELLDYDELPLESRIDTDALYAAWKRVWRELDVGFAPIDPERMFATRAPKVLEPDADEPW